MISIESVLRYLIRLRKRRRTTTWYRKSGKDASAEVHLTCSMQYREDAVVVVGSTLGKLSRLEKFNLITGVLRGIEQHSWWLHTMGRQDVLGY